MPSRSRSLILVPAIIGACLFAGTLQVVGVAVSGPMSMATQPSAALPRADRDVDPDPGRAADAVDAGLVEIPIEVPSASADAISL